MKDKTCHICQKTFARPYNLTQHNKKFHSNETQETNPEMEPEMIPHITTNPSSSRTHNTYGLTGDIDNEGTKWVEVPNLLHPFTCMVAGPTFSGKSTFVKQLVQERNDRIHLPPEFVMWCYSEWQPIFEHLRDINFHQGLPDLEKFDPNARNLLIIDDLMDKVDGRVSELFTKGSHHRNISVIYIVQNLFHNAKQHRTISLNTQYMVLFKNPRDSSQIMHLARQMFPNDPAYLQNVYIDATSPPFGYLFVDLKQETPDLLRLRTDILKPMQFVYVPEV